MEHTRRFSVLTPQSPDLNPIDNFLECGRKGDSIPGCTANQFRRIRECHNNSTGPNFERVLPEH